MHGRQINPYDISHFARCNTLVLISITHNIQCNYAFFYPHQKRGEKKLKTKKTGWSLSVMYTENLAIYVISVCDFNQRQSRD